MTPRSIRRAAERKAAKLAKKLNAREARSTGATGPATPENKAESCLNAIGVQGDTGTGSIHQPQKYRRPLVRGQSKPHALTGNFRVMPFESQAAFDELCIMLRDEHQPGTATEIVLVDRMAEHIWLSQRAQKFADAAFLDHDEKMMALMLRYRTTHHRAFHTSLAELRMVRKERRQHDEEFESQTGESGKPVPSDQSDARTIRMPTPTFAPNVNPPSPTESCHTVGKCVP